METRAERERSRTSALISFNSSRLAVRLSTLGLSNRWILKFKSTLLKSFQMQLNLQWMQIMERFLQILQASIITTFE